MATSDSIGAAYLSDIIKRFAIYRDLSERAIAQVDDDGLFASTDEESNSIAVIVQHVAGNLRSRWTDFLTTDGEKPDRNRDAEFEQREQSREALLADWRDGFACLERTLATLTPDDLLRTVHIRAEPMSVLEAIDRGLAHVAYHAGQIVYRAKQLSADEWTTLSMPRVRRTK